MHAKYVLFCAIVYKGMFESILLYITLVLSSSPMLSWISHSPKLNLQVGFAAACEAHKVSTSHPNFRRSLQHNPELKRNN